MRNPILYLIIIGVCILSSCNMQQRGSGALPKELVQAENIMYENPDSALQILQAMPIPSEKEEHATWALLLTQAKYKCFVDQSDSLVNIAHDYFMKKNNVKRKALTLYLKGALFYEMNKLDKALSYYLKAEKICVLSDDNRLAYLISSHISRMYAERGLYDYSFIHAEKSKEYAILAKDSLYLMDSYMALARTQTVQKRYQTAIDYYDKAIDIGIKYRNKKKVTSALLEKIEVLIKIDQYTEALNTTQKLNKSYINTSGYFVLGHLYYKLNKPDSAYFYLNKAIESNNIYTQQSAYQVLFYLSKKNQDYKKNSDYSTILWKINDSINQIDRNKTLIEMQEKYDNERVINEKNRAEKRGLIILCISIGIIGIIISCYQWKVLRQKNELENKRKELNNLNKQLAENNDKIAQNEARMEMAAQVEVVDMTEELKEKEAAIKNMRIQNELLKKTNEELQHKINKHVIVQQENSKEVERLSQLAEQNTYLRKREVFLSNQLLKMDEMVTNLKQEPDCLKDNQWQELKEKTDALFDGYTERLLKRVPTLTTHDIHICCLIKLSFSHIAISDILGISSTSVSRQKQRIKERIVQQVGPLGENVLLDVWLKEF